MLVLSIQQPFMHAIFWNGSTSFFLLALFRCSIFRRRHMKPMILTTPPTQNGTTPKWFLTIFIQEPPFVAIDLQKNMQKVYSMCDETC